MAVIRQGGGPNLPVQLDPVQQLVNVRWPAKFTHLSVLFDVHFQKENSGNIDLGCVPHDAADEDELYANQYLVSSGYKFPDGFTAPTIIGRRKATGGWASIDPDDVEIDGMPAFPIDLAVDAWERPAGFWSKFTFSSNSPDGPVYSAASITPSVDNRFVWLHPTGNNMDITTFAGDPFKDTIDAQVATRGTAFTGDQLCINNTVSASRRYTEVVDSPQNFNHLQPVTEMTAIYEGDTYVAVGSFLQERTPMSDSTLHILLERQDGSS